MKYRDQATAGLDKTATKMQRMQKEYNVLGSKFTKTGRTMQNVGKGLIAGVTMPIAGITTASVKVGAEFEAQMDRVGAIAGVTGQDLAPLTEQAKKLGLETQFGATEAAKGMENLASAGFSANEIVGAMPGLLNLAAVSGGDVAASAEQASNAFRAFGMTDPAQMRHISDVFARAAADTNAEAADMGEALKMVAPVAHSMGMSIEETAAAIGVMSDSGIKGTMAGTALRGAMSRLTKPTKAMKETMDAYGLSFYDAQGNMLPLQDQLGMMQDKFAGLTQEQKSHALTTLFGQNSVAGMLALIDKGPSAFGELTDSLKNSDGAAADMAAQMNDNTMGKLQRLKNTLEGAAIVIKDAVAPSIEKLTGKIQSIVSWFSNLEPKQQQQIIKMAGIAAAIGPVVFIAGKLTSTLGKMIRTFPKVAGGFAKLGKVFMTNPAGIVIVAIAALVMLLMHLYKTNSKVREAFQKGWRDIKKAFAPVMEALKPLLPYLKKFGKFLQDTVLPIVGKVVAFVVKYAIKGIILAIKGIVKVVRFVAGVIVTAIAVIKAVIGGIIAAFNAVKEFITVTVPGFFWSAVGKIMEFWGGVGDFFKGIFDTIVGVFVGIGTTVADAISGAFKFVVNGVLAGVETVLNGPIRLFNNALGVINKIPGVEIPLIPLFDLPRLAKGTKSWAGGPAMVHEAGGEIIDLPRGSRVYPHDQSLKMMQKGEGKVVNIRVAKLADTIVVREDADIDKIADRLAERLEEVADMVA
jgi:TP901 family phage tail tape measure protein